MLEDPPILEATPPRSPVRTPEPTVPSDAQEPFPLSPAAINIRPTLRRSGSSDSISIAGMDIHIPKRSSPEYTPQRIRSYFTPSALPSTALTQLSTISKQPLTSLAETTASASQFNTLATSRATGEGRRGLETIFVASNSSRETNDAPTPPSGVAGRLGGWVRSKWGVTPTRSTGDLRSVSASHASTTPSRRPRLATLLEAPALQSEPEVPHPSLDADDNPSSKATSQGGEEANVKSSPPRAIPGRAASISTTSTGSTLGKRGGHRGSGTSRSVGSGGGGGASGSLSTSVMMMPNSMRMPGINQKGSIPGFWVMQRAPSQVEVEMVDEGALREGMAEGLGG